MTEATTPRGRLRYGDRAIRVTQDPVDPPGEETITYAPDPLDPTKTIAYRSHSFGAPAAPAIPEPLIETLRSRVVQANTVYGQLQAERIEAERMENDALVALKEAQAAFDRHIQEFGESFPGTNSMSLNNS